MCCKHRKQVIIETHYIAQTIASYSQRTLWSDGHCLDTLVVAINDVDD